MNPVVELFADLGQWLEKSSKDKYNAIILVLISLISPLGFIFAASLIAHAYRKNKKKR